jgi:hypothetical protein
MNYAMVITRCFILLAVMICTPCQARSGVHLPADGIVASEGVAVKIAEAILPVVFTEAEIAKFRPYKAHLKEGVWTVYGTLKRGSRGGTPTVRIQKKDGKVLEIWHSQ